MTGILKRLMVLLISMAFFGAMPVMADQQKININTATEKELCQLKRVGTKYAARIVKYREEVGKFEAPEDIMKVQGIGQRTFEANADVIVVADEKKKVAKTAN